MFAMFNTYSAIKKKTPKKEFNRENFINLLVCEFFDTSRADAKVEVCCNLANFAYDPINFEYLRKSNALQIFLTSISSNNEKLIVAGITGICNFCLDPEVKNHLVTRDSIKCIKDLLKSYNSEIILKAITTLILLIDDQTLSDIGDLELISQIISLNQSDNNRIKTLTSLFLNEIENKAEKS